LCGPGRYEEAIVMLKEALDNLTTLNLTESEKYKKYSRKLKSISDLLRN